MSEQIPPEHHQANVTEHPVFDEPEGSYEAFSATEGQRGLKPNQFLSGERQVGEVPLPSGFTAVHEVTRDGMKQVRIVGPPSTPGPRTAAEFYGTRYDATPEEKRVLDEQRAAIEKGYVGEQRSLARSLGKLAARITGRPITRR